MIAAWAAWEQVLTEAGARIPLRNLEGMLVNTHVPCPPGDQRRLDLVALSLNADRERTLFCDVTELSPIAGNGNARPGAGNRDGCILERAEDENNENYAEAEINENNEN